MQSYNATVIESRPDWLTMTARDEVKRLWLDKLASRIFYDQAAAGADCRPLQWQGYSGIQTKEARYGRRSDTDLLVLSGALAADQLDRALPLADNVSRLDLCVTARIDVPADLLIEESYEQTAAFRSRAGRSPQAQLIQNSWGGYTLNIGSRRSRAYGRVYNKHAQSELDYYAGCVRHELEAKGKLATSLAARVAASPDRDATCRTLVHQYLSGWGCPTLYESGEEEQRVAPFRRRTDDTSRLLWLERQVAPTLRRLQKKGLAPQAASALGLELPKL